MYTNITTQDILAIIILLFVGFNLGVAQGIFGVLTIGAVGLVTREGGDTT
tara:strand:+ start:149 stop:298 length:150 start_codon:yes stop_codon:yes gene_type:complete